MNRKLSKRERQLRLIRLCVKKDYSANKIQKMLQRKGLGMKRKGLLALVRKKKGVRKTRVSVKYVPHKYRPKLIVEKRIAVYGTVGGKSRRAELSGSGRALYRTMLHLTKHPPKKRFLNARASDVAIMPEVFLDFYEEWDEHPKVFS